MYKALLGFAIVLITISTAVSQGRKDTEAALIGYWVSSEAVVEIRPKSQILINGDRYEWAIIGKTLVVSQGDEAADFPFELKGDTLTVWLEGRKIAYSRTDKDGAEEAMAALAKRGGGAGGRSDGGAGGGGGNPQDLVGKWCYSANVQAQGGGRQSDICFTLHPDGTYEYSGETSNSNIYGGSNSQSRDAGRWSATATTLTARSNSGQTKTYTLEKRNHPRTGDPMLMVDGDAFVTYYQKRPW